MNEKENELKIERRLYSYLLEMEDKNKKELEWVLRRKSTMEYRIKELEKIISTDRPEMIREASKKIITYDECDEPISRIQERIAPYNSYGRE